MHGPATYREFAPAPALQPFVECYWWHASPAKVRAESRYVLPDGCIDIVLNLSEGAPAAEQARVVGTMRRPLEVRGGGAAQFAGVRFRPGKARLFTDFRAAELTDRAAALADFWGRGAHDLFSRAAEASARATAAALERALLARMPQRPGDKRVDAAVSAILHSRGRIPVQELANAQGVSRQHLKKCFQDWVGASPKFFSRVVRFRNLLTRTRATPRVRWADVAAECGYYDQAHLIADFRELAETTPEAYRREAQAA